MSLSTIILKLFRENNRVERIWKLAQVDFKKRYYNDSLGLLWAFINPVLRTLIYYVIFTFVFKKSVEDIPNYGLFIFSGLIIWMAFVENIKKGMNVLNRKSYLIENIKVNKIDLFISNTFAVLFGSLFNIIGYLMIAIAFGIQFSSNALGLVLVIANVALIGTGASMILAIINIFLKDISHILDILILLGFWGSGIFFRGELILDKVPYFIYLNPFIGIIENMRNVVLFDNPVNWKYMLIGFVYGFILLVIGYFLKKRFAGLALEKK